MPPRLTARQQALADKKQAKEAEAKANAEAEAQKKAEALAKKAAKEAENDADDEEEEAPATHKGRGKGKGKTAATKGKTPKKGKAAAAKKANNGVEDDEDDNGDDDDQPSATSKSNGKGKAAAAPKKKAAPKKAATTKKAAAGTKGRKRTAAQMKMDEDEDEDNNNNLEDGEEEEEEGDPQPPAKKAKTGPGPQANPRVRRQSGVDNNSIFKTAVRPNNPRKQLAGTKSAFEIPRKTASPPNHSSTPPSSPPPTSSPPQPQSFPDRRSSSSANREAGELSRLYQQRKARRREMQQQQQRRGPPVEVSVRNGMEGVAKRTVQFNRDDDVDDDDEPPRRRRRGRQRRGRQEDDEEEEEEEDDLDRDGEDEEMRDQEEVEREEREREEREREEREQEEQDARELQELEGAVTRAVAQVGRSGLRRGLEALGAPGAAQVLEALGALEAPAPGAAGPGATAVAGGGDSDPDPSDISSSSVSSNTSATSEQTYRTTPNIQGGNEELQRLRTRLTQLRANYDNRLQHARDHNLPYTQGVFTRARGHPYEDPTTPEDLARDFAHLKYLVQKLVSKIPLDQERMAELTVELDDIREEFRGLSSFWRNYWRPDRPVFARWLLETLIWRRLHRLIFDRQRSEYFAFGHGRGMLTELWVTSLAACVEVEFPESVDELCELRARLATFLKEMYEQENPSRVARAFEEVFCRGILDFLREHVEDDDGLEPGIYLHEERAERELEMQELAVQIIDHASDLNSRMLRSSGNWALIYKDPRTDHRGLYSYQCMPNVMRVRDLGDEYVVRENPTGDLGPIQRDDEGGQVALTITPGLWDFTEWARIEIPFVVPHVRSEVSLQRHRAAVEKGEKEQRSKKQKRRAA